METEGFLDYQGRAGIISIVRWNLRPVIFGVDPFKILFEGSRASKRTALPRMDPLPYGCSPRGHRLLVIGKSALEVIQDGSNAYWNGVWGRGCDEEEISEEKRLFTDWRQGIQ